MAIDTAVPDSFAPDQEIPDSSLYIGTPLAVTIAGERAPVKRGTLRVENEVDRQSIAEFMIARRGLSFTPKQGHPIEVISQALNKVIFRGWIYDLNRKSKLHKDQDNNIQHFSIQCKDNHYLASKRRIRYTAKDISAGQVARDIVDEKLTQESVTYTSDSIEEGKTLDSVSFNFLTVEDALNELAEGQGFWWMIDENRILHFKAYDSGDKTWTLSPSNIKGQININESNYKYRNKQFINGVKDITAPQTESFVGDGERTTFTVAYDIAESPTIKVNGTEKTTAPKGTGDADWYWSKGKDTITQDSDNISLTSSDTLTVEYRGFIQIIIEASKQNEINKRKELSNNITSGEVDHVTGRPDIEGQDRAFQRAGALLAKYSRDSKTLKYQTLSGGIHAGQIQELDETAFAQYGFDQSNGLPNTLISKVVIEPQGDTLVYEIESNLGPKHDTWQEIFGKLKKYTERAISESAISASQVTQNYTFSETWSETETPNIFQEFYADGTYNAGDSELPMFPEKRIEYLAWYDSSGNEIGRKQISQGELSGDPINEVYTLTRLEAQEAVGTIGYLGWWGGENASGTKGSGYELDKQAQGTEKTDIEAWQIEKYDYKW